MGGPEIVIPGNILSMVFPARRPRSPPGNIEDPPNFPEGSDPALRPLREFQYKRFLSSTKIHSHNMSDGRRGRAKYRKHVAKHSRVEAKCRNYSRGRFVEDDGTSGAYQVMQGDEDNAVVLQTLPNLGYRRAITNYVEGPHWKTAEEWEEYDKQQLEMASAAAIGTVNPANTIAVPSNTTAASTTMDRLEVDSGFGASSDIAEADTEGDRVFLKRSASGMASIEEENVADEDEPSAFMDAYSDMIRYADGEEEEE